MLAVPNSDKLIYIFHLNHQKNSWLSRIFFQNLKL